MAEAFAGFLSGHFDGYIQDQLNSHDQFWRNVCKLPTELLLSVGTYCWSVPFLHICVRKQRILAMSKPPNSIEDPRTTEHAWIEAGVRDDALATTNLGCIVPSYSNLGTAPRSLCVLYNDIGCVAIGSSLKPHDKLQGWYRMLHEHEARLKFFYKGNIVEDILALPELPAACLWDTPNPPILLPQNTFGLDRKHTPRRRDPCIFVRMRQSMINSRNRCITAAFEFGGSMIDIATHAAADTALPIYDRLDEYGDNITWLTATLDDNEDVVDVVIRYHLRAHWANPRDCGIMLATSSGRSIYLTSRRDFLRRPYSYRHLGGKDGQVITSICHNVFECAGHRQEPYNVLRGADTSLHLGVTCQEHSNSSIPVSKSIWSPTEPLSLLPEIVGFPRKSSHFFWSVQVIEGEDFRACIDNSKAHHPCIGLQFNNDFLGQWRNDRKIIAISQPREWRLINVLSSDPLYLPNPMGLPYVCLVKAADIEPTHEALPIRGRLEWWYSRKSSIVRRLVV